jgi:hypothetical protein
VLFISASSLCQADAALFIYFFLSMHCRTLTVQGIGTIIAGVLSEKLEDIIIGLLQFFIFVFGWIWAIVWGVLMIIRMHEKPENNKKKKDKSKKSKKEGKSETAAER